MAAIRGAPPQWKVQMVEELKRILTSYPTIAIVGFRGVPATQMQDIRRKFRGKALIKVIKNTLLEKAIEALGDKYEKLKDYIYDQTAIVATNMNPFKLYKMLEETKVPSPLKPGQVSPVDVVVEKGPTPFPPGPIIGELQAAGLPAAIERGKVVIKETVTVVRAGEVVKPELARILEKLDIKPIKIGLDVRAIYDNGIILTPDVLAIDTEKVIEEISKAYQNAINLALNIAYVTKETAELLIMKAVMEAKNLAINACIIEKDVIPDLLARAYSQMLALASMLPDEALDDDLKNRLSGVKVTKEEVEEKKEEEKKEEEEKEEEKSEEEALEGLGALFG